MSGRSLLSLAIHWIGILCLIHPLGAHSVDSEDGVTVTTGQSVIPQLSSVNVNPQKILLILGLREEANQLVRISVFEEFSGMDVESVDAHVAGSPDYQWPEADLYLAAGTTGCQVAVQSVKNQRILCTLLTEEGFLSLNTGNLEHERLSALVIDQPVSRQARVANRIYPSLSRFSVFSSSETWPDVSAESIAIDRFPYYASVSLSTQLSDVLNAHDALIATSDNSIYNASTLSTVLLTAYGYHKPVIGFSRAYVKAGALITSYSTPAQILREIAQRLNSSSMFQDDAPIITYPRYFSVVDNMSVAKSLGLIRSSQINSGQTLSDEDFEP